MRISDKQTEEFAYYIKDDILPFIRDNWDDYVKYLEEQSENDPQCADELAKIKSGEVTKPI